ncbi:MAG: undecaprenyldiphospho-muramoylpentapeptide beta-N-acetylglucosaminyltransferase [Oscillospiraceae bacterium]|nr:undecaprenyldiphospho-muramoylpentapeptide beta-N-acetylglucosaminyltransferase [Oscillospiraceae bacterium]
MNILFTCGGTAGHVNPAVALARLFQQEHPSCNVLFVGADGGMETRLVPKEGYEIRTVTITNFRRSLKPANIIHNIGTLKNMVTSKAQARRILDEFKPDLVVGTGGYASYPIVKQAARRGIPTAVHESNAVPGLTTKALSKVVDCVMVGFEESRAHYDCPDKVVVTGTPVRGDFFRYTRAEARAQLGITDDRPLLLSYWGSLGASVMNALTVELLERQQKDGLPFHHIHGAGRDFASMMEALQAKGISAPELQVREYIYDMPLVMAAADVVLCRAGASTVSELAAIGKPSVLVPSPNVTANHQEKNARVLERQGGAVVLTEPDCTAEVLYTTLCDLLRDPSRRAEMSRALTATAVVDAGSIIYKTLVNLLPDKNR